MGAAVVAPGRSLRAAAPASWLARCCRAEACRASRLARRLLGLDPIGDFASLLHVVFPDAGERAELDCRAARQRAANPALDEEAARVRAFSELVDERRFPLDDVVRWDPEAATYAALLEGIPLVRYGWCYEDLHAAPGDHRLGHNLLRALAADPAAGDDGIAGRGALLDSLCACGIPATLLLPLTDHGLPAATLQARLGGTRLAAASDFARWVACDTGLACLDSSDDDGFDDAPWSRHNVTVLTAQWPRARALLEEIDALASWLEAAPPARFAALLAAAGLSAGVDSRGGPA